MSKSQIKTEFYKNYEGWVKSFNTGLCQDENGNHLPWMPYDLIEYLEKNLKKSDIVFEYGFGTSSIFFAKRVKKVVSIETDPRWHAMMLRLIDDLKIDNIEVILMVDGLENEKYEETANIFARNSAINYGFDWIIVDSLKRSKCVKNAINTLSHDGKILLDDSQRQNYKKIHEFMTENKFQCQEFEGISPGQIKSKKSWIFSR